MSGPRHSTSREGGAWDGGGWEVAMAMARAGAG
eukprot:CAMPEP_0202875924 /NCGR_PEP_ID=MMETSP1391-20130828/28170_1 /ASSEMBLY_ACC=CAM_ASM_000867 /TAXON_ID=1034604 /ORGANISM="Chlamydomonas leiostraca, Strain SAG 11-49" /LENGTH=32 /DNA_ID= /DNA_START= /DNA_END= /DNA_ORIENTATION=